VFQQNFLKKMMMAKVSMMQKWAQQVEKAAFVKEKQTDKDDE